MNQIVKSLLAGALAISAVACSQDDAPETAAQQAPANPHANMPNHPAVGATQNQGKVVYLTEAGGYKYIRVESGGQFVWLATNQASVAVGDNAAWGQAAAMNNFESKALGRTFDRILFVGNVVKAQPGQVAAGGNVGVIKAALVSGGYSYLEVEQDGNMKWIAVPQAQVAVGDKVQWRGGAVMRNFTSPSLNRTFDQIIFAGGVQQVN